MKNVPSMAAPKEKKEGAKTGKLMDNQEQSLRGDITEEIKAVKCPTTIMIPYEVKKRAQALASREGTTLTFMITLALKKQIAEDSIWI